MRLPGKVAVITGAASGIGRATALRFCDEGASVAILDRDAHRGEAVFQEIRTRGRRAIFISADVSIEKQVQDAIERASAEFGAPHILVNNAAAFVFGAQDATEA